MKHINQFNLFKNNTLGWIKTKFYSYNENVQQALSILKKVNKAENNTSYRKIRKMLSGHDGYVGFFTKLHFINKVSINDLENLLDIIIEQRNLIRSLPKNLIDYDNYEELIDDIEITKVKTNAKKILNEFPAKQKNFFNLENKEDVNLLDLLYKKENKNIFIRKISAYQSKTTLVSRLKSFLNSDSSSDFDKIFNQIKKINVDIVHSSKEDNLIICLIKDYSECAEIGSDTAWCIARSETTFKNYVPNKLTFQYAIYLTDKKASDDKRKIGATFTKKGYSTAHSVTDEHVGETKLKSILKEYNYDIDELIVRKENIKNINTLDVKDLLSLGFKIEEIISIKNSYTTEDLNLLPKEFVDENNLIDKVEIDGSLLKNYTYSEIEEKNIIVRIKDGTLNVEDISHIPPRIVNKNREILLTKFKKEKESRRGNDRKPSQKEIFIEHFTKPKSEIENIYDYKITTESYFNTNVDLTIQKLRFYMVGPYDYSFEEICKSGLFSNISTSEFSKIKKFLDGSGYKYTDKEISSYLFYISYKSQISTNVDIYYKIIKLGIDCKEEFMDYITRYTKAWDKWDKDKIENSFTKEELENFYNKDQEGNFIKDVEYASKYARVAHRKDIVEMTPDRFYDKWNNYLKIKKIPYASNVIPIGVIAIYASLDKINELSNVEFDWKSKDFVHELAKYICGEWTQNSSQTIGLELTRTQKKSIYKWISRNFMTPILYDLEDIFNPGRPKDYQLQVLYYLYDKDSFEEYLDNCKQVKDNDYYSSNNGKKIYYTLRISNLTALVNYLLKSKKYDKIIEIISKVLEWKMTNDEAKRTKEWMVGKLYGESNYTSDLKIYTDNFKDMVESFRPDITNYKRDRRRDAW